MIENLVACPECNRRGFMKIDSDTYKCRNCEVKVDGLYISKKVVQEAVIRAILKKDEEERRIDSALNYHSLLIRRQNE